LVFSLGFNDVDSDLLFFSSGSGEIKIFLAELIFKSFLPFFLKSLVESSSSLLIIFILLFSFSFKL
jgi:hypothetical protein